MQLESPRSNFPARVEPGAQVFEAPAGQTLLVAMEQAGIEWPSSCRNGTCRTCIGQLSQGEVRYEIQWPGLSLEEKASNHVLPCVAYAISPLTLCPVA
jgi:ferredoxin